MGFWGGDFQSQFARLYHSGFALIQYSGVAFFAGEDDKVTIIYKKIALETGAGKLYIEAD